MNEGKKEWCCKKMALYRPRVKEREREIEKAAASGD